MYISGIREELKMGGCHMTLVRTDPGAEHRGFTFFAVPLNDNPCVTTTLVEDWGRQGISTGGFNMENLPLPDKNRIGEANRGFYYAMEGFTLARILIGATCVGAAEAGLQMGIDYIKQRQAFGHPLAAYQGISFPAAERYTDIETARLLTYKAAWMADEMYTRKAYKHKEVALRGGDGQAAGARHGLRDPERGGQLAGRHGLHQGVSHRDGHPRRALLLHRRRGCA